MLNNTFWVKTNKITLSQILPKLIHQINTPLIHSRDITLFQIHSFDFFNSNL
jgi:hypothetical protein